MYKHKCPICDEEMTGGRDIMDNWLMLEEWYDCPRGHYSFHWAHGLTTETVAGKEYVTSSFPGNDPRCEWQNMFCRQHIKLLRIFDKIKKYLKVGESKK